jgi:hypothetical protein
LGYAESLDLFEETRQARLPGRHHCRRLAPQRQQRQQRQRGKPARASSGGLPEGAASGRLRHGLSLIAKYDLPDITGHDCISSWRKADPGPAFPMLELRKANGLSGVPVVFDQKGNPLPV